MTLRFTRRALRQIEEVRAYIHQHDPQASNRIVARIGEAIEGLTLHPQRGRPGRVPGTRELVVSRTPYLVAYRVVDASIEVLAVLHGARLWPGSKR